MSDVHGRSRALTRLVGAPGGDRWTRIGGFDPTVLCARVGRRAWEHFRRVEYGRYAYAGPCVEFHDMADMVAADGCCCGNPACDGRAAPVDGDPTGDPGGGSR